MTAKNDLRGLADTLADELQDARRASEATEDDQLRPCQPSELRALWEKDSSKLQTNPLLAQLNAQAWQRARDTLSRDVACLPEDPAHLQRLIAQLSTNPDTPLNTWVASESQAVRDGAAALLNDPAFESAPRSHTPLAAASKAGKGGDVLVLSGRGAPWSDSDLSGGGVQRLVLDTSGSVEDLLASAPDEICDHVTHHVTRQQEQLGSRDEVHEQGGYPEASTPRGGAGGGGLQAGWMTFGSPAGPDADVPKYLARLKSASTDERIQALTCLMGEGSPLLPEDLLGAACWPDLCDTLGTLLTTAHESDALRVSHTAVQLVMQLAHEACATSTPHAAALLVAVLPATVQLLAAPCAEAVAAGVRDLTQDGSGDNSRCGSATQGTEVVACTHLALSAVTVQLLRVLALDWHFVPTAQQTACVDAVCAALVACCTATSAVAPADSAAAAMFTLAPHAGWLLRLAGSANSCAAFARAAAAATQGSTGRSLLQTVQTHFAASQPSQTTTDNSHAAREHACICCACALLSVPAAVWSEGLFTQQARTELLQRVVARVSALCMGCGAAVAGWLESWEGLLGSLAKTDPGLWTDTALTALLPRSSSSDTPTAVHQPHMQVVASVWSGLAQSQAGARLLAQSACTTAAVQWCVKVLTPQPHTDTQQDSTAMVSIAADVLCATMTAAEQAGAGVAGQQLVCSIAEQLIACLRRPGTGQRGVQAFQGSACVAADVLMRACCAQPLVVALLERQEETFVSSLAAHAVACISNQTPDSGVPDGVLGVQAESEGHSSHAWRVAAATVMAVSPRLQAALLKRGWLNSWLQQPLGGRQPADAALLLSRDPADEPALQPLVSVQATLGWCGVARQLVTRSQEHPGCCEAQALEALVCSLDLAPSEGSNETTTPRLPLRLGTDSQTQLICGQSPPEACSAALACLATWAHRPAALSDLRSATHVQWYLQRIIASHTHSEDNPLQTATQPQTHTQLQAQLREQLRADPMLRQAMVLSDRLSVLSVGVTEGHIEGEGDVSSGIESDKGSGLRTAASVCWPEGAISSIVQQDAGMSDPHAWLSQASAALQADMRHSAALDVRALSVLVQRCVLVAWPGLRARAGGCEQLPWANTGPVQPWQTQPVPISANTSETTAPSDQALRMVHSTLTALHSQATTQPSLTLATTTNTAPRTRPTTARHPEHPCLPPADAHTLAAWLDSACMALGSPQGAAGYSDDTGDSFLVTLGALLGASSPSAARGATELAFGLHKSAGAAYVWPRACERMGGGLAIRVRAAVCSAVQTVLRDSEPRVWVALGGHSGVGMGALLHCVVRWLGCGESMVQGPGGGLAWLGVLSGEQVVAALAMHLLLGPDYLVYGIVAMLKQVEEDLVAACLRGDIVSWLAQEPLAGCTWAASIQHMERLCAAHRQDILPLLMSVLE